MDNPGKRIAFTAVFLLMVFLISLYVKHAMHAGYISTYVLPPVIGEWKGADASTDVLEFLQRELGAQSIIFRTYTNGAGSINLYLAYYKDIDSAHKVHSPTVCYPGQGWAVTSDTIVQLNDNSEINRLIIEKEREKELVYNWWQTGDMILPKNSRNRFYQMYKSILGKNPSTLWVRLSVSADQVNNHERELLAFSNELMPLLDNYFKH